MAPKMQSRLQEFADHPIIGETRGIGLLGAVELVANKSTKAPFDAKAAVGPFLAKRAQNHGLIVRPIGDTIAFCPPLIISESEINLMFDVFKLALDETYSMVRERGLV